MKFSIIYCGFQKDLFDLNPKLTKEDNNKLLTKWYTQGRLNGVKREVNRMKVSTQMKKILPSNYCYDYLNEKYDQAIQPGMLIVIYEGELEVDFSKEDISSKQSRFGQLLKEMCYKKSAIRVEGNLTDFKMNNGKYKHIIMDEKEYKQMMRIVKNQRKNQAN